MGRPKSIRDDYPPYLCWINLKRQDEYCRDNLESIEVKTKNERRKVFSRNYQIATHGGIELGFECEVFEVLEWYHFIRTENTFDEAVFACQSRSAQCRNFLSIEWHQNSVEVFRCETELSCLLLTGN